MTKNAASSTDATQEVCDTLPLYHHTPSICDTFIHPSGIYGLPSENTAYGSSLVPLQDQSGLYGIINMVDSFLICKINVQGIIEWQVQLTFEPIFANYIAIHHAILDQDGMIVIALTTAGTTHYSALRILKFNPLSRQVIWSKKIQYNRYFFGLALVEDPQKKRYLLSAYEGDLLAFRTDNGNMELIADTFNSLSVTITDMILQDSFLFATGFHHDTLSLLPPTLMIFKFNLYSHKPIWAVHTIDDVFDGNDRKNPIMCMDETALYVAYSRITGNHFQLYKLTVHGFLEWKKDIELPGFIIQYHDISSASDGFIIHGNTVSETGASLCLQAQMTSHGEVSWIKMYENIPGVFPAYNLNLNVMQIVGDYIFSFRHPLDATQGDTSRFMILRTSLDGTPLNSCATISVPDVIIRDLDEVDFIPFDVTTTLVDRMASDYFHQPSPVSFYTFPACDRTDVAYQYVTTSLCPGQIIEGYDNTGVFTDTFSTAEGCDSIRVLTLFAASPTTSSQTFFLCPGDTLFGYHLPGVYSDTFSLPSGCDSIRSLTLRTIDCPEIITYDLNDCRAYMSDGSLMDYSEFVPLYSASFHCGAASATTLYRESPAIQKHSCTPGIADTKAMCISADTACAYSPGHDASLRFDITLTPSPDSAILLSGFSFFQKAPQQYTWIDGPYGSNNLPTHYGLRIIRDQQEIFRLTDSPTTSDWTQEVYSFADHPDFIVHSTPATFEFELLPYCPVGIEAQVSVWDIEDVAVSAACIPNGAQPGPISGKVSNVLGLPYDGAPLYLRSSDLLQAPLRCITPSNGIFSFDHLHAQHGYTLQAFLDEGHLQGVSTLDLIRLQRHLLGIDPITTPGDFIAADVHRDGRLSTLDFIDIQRLILGDSPLFPQNTSWRFGILPDRIYDQGENTMIEKINFESIPSEGITQHLTAIKIGDINGDALPAPRPWLQPRHDAPPFTLHIYSSSFGDTLMRAFVTTEDGDFRGLQATIPCEPHHTISITSEAFPLTDQQFRVHDGLIRISCTMPDGLFIPSGTPLFTLISSKTDSMNLSPLSTHFPLQDDNLIAPEIYLNEALDVRSLNILPAPDQVSTPEPLSMRILPNPSSSQARIEFYLPATSEVTIRFFDLSGRIYDSISIHHCQAGWHTVDLSPLKFPPGIIIAEMNACGMTNRDKWVRW